MKPLLTLGILAALAAGSPALAQDKGTTTAPSDRAAPKSTAKDVQRLSRDDRNFIEKAAAAGMAEVETGKLAASKAQNPDIKKFGQQMVDDHTKVNEELKALASRKGVQLPTSLDRRHAGDMKKLEKASGAEFDREYIRSAGTRDHEDTRKLFEKASKDAKDPDVKAFAEKHLPHLVKHEETARSLAGSARNAKK